MRLLFSVLVLLNFCVLLPAQSSTWKQSATFATAAGPLASTTADFNGDGHIDIAVSNTAVQSVSILLGIGDGTFHPRIDYSTAGCQPGQLIARDFNRDGHIDLLSSCTLTSRIMVLPGRGDGTFGAPVFTATPFPVVSGFLDGFVEPLTAGDVNGDGIPDLALIIQTTETVGLTSPGAIGQAVLMTGNGNGAFTLARTLSIAPPNTEPYALQLADVNGDGKLDLVGIAFTYNSAGLVNPLTAFLIVAPGDGTGSFQFANSYPLTGIPQTGMLLGDVNGDGKTDVVFAGLSISAILNGDETDFSGVGVFLGAGNGTFTRSYSVEDAQTAQLNQATVGSAMAPVLGTGHPDIVAVVLLDNPVNDAVTGSLIVRPNNGDGTFGTPQVLMNSSALPFSLSLADFNGDGAADILTFNFQTNLLGLLFSEDLLDNIDSVGAGIATFPSATGSVLLNATPAKTFTNTNAASFQTGSLATSSIVSAFGTNLASATASASGLPLPTTLGNTGIAVTDALGVKRAAPLFYVSPTQVNYAIPDGTATGTAIIAITNSSSTVTVQQPIVAVSPGLFNASNVAIAQVYTYNGSAAPVVTSTVAVNVQSQFSAAPIDVLGGSSVFLVLYGTGIRNHLNPVVATVGSTKITSAFAGAQGVYFGEDQVNIQLPTTLAGAGLVDVTLSVDGQTSNSVQILLQ